jgi:23S rRNA-/tRNA-specific pseudouridylate synthase
LHQMLGLWCGAGIATVAETTGPNSLMDIVRRQTGVFGAEPGHRLDKPVSGVLLLGKSRRQAARLLDKIQKKDMIEKVYIARVRRRTQPPDSQDTAAAAGAAAAAASAAAVARDCEFPPEEFTVAAPIGWRSADNKAIVHAEGAVSSSEGSDAPALAVTHFKRLSGGGGSSAALPDGTVLIACRPKTGQRHQIRVHLAHIGWPIANDALYGAVLLLAAPFGCSSWLLYWHTLCLAVLSCA